MLHNKRHQQQELTERHRKIQICSSAMSANLIMRKNARCIQAHGSDISSWERCHQSQCAFSTVIWLWFTHSAAQQESAISGLSSWNSEQRFLWQVTHQWPTRCRPLITDLFGVGVSCQTNVVYSSGSSWLHTHEKEEIDITLYCLSSFAGAADETLGY